MLNRQNVINSFSALLLVLFFATAIFIKFFRFSDLATYNAEIAQHYLEIIKLNNKPVLLAGPLTSHPWLRLSSTAYYFFYPIFYAAHFHPLTLPFLWAATSCLLIILNYFVIKKIFDRLTALLSSLFLLISPNILLMDHNSGFFPFIIPLTYLLLWQSHTVFFQKKGKIWIIFLLISLMCTLHAAAIFLLPFYLGAAILKKAFHKKNIIKSIFAFFIPQLPFILLDSIHSFSSMTQFILWIPYKMVNFLTGKTLGVDKVITQDKTSILIVDFFKQILFPQMTPWWIGVILLIIFCAGFLFFLKKNRDSFTFFLLAQLLFGILALCIHKNPPAHYFTPLLVLPVILTSQFFSFLLRNTRLRSVAISLLIFIIICDSTFIFSPKYLFATPTLNSFSVQMEISQAILNDTGSQPFTLTRLGDFDYYSGGFKENYDYLLWWQGNKPVEKADLHYYIVEDATKMPADADMVKVAEVNGVKILKRYDQQ